MNENIEMLEYIYQNAKMGKSTIDQILKETRDLEFKDVLEEQIKDYEYVAYESEKLLENKNKEAKDLPKITEIMTYFNIKMSMAKDDTSSHIAEMLLRGSNMGIIEISKNLNKYKNIDHSIKVLGEKLLNIEESNYDKLKKYV